MSKTGRKILEPFHAVIDIGKTNKKVFVYDSGLNCVWKRTEQFEEYEENGVIYEPINDIDEWVFGGLATAASEFNIRSVSVTTHGATAAYIDRNGDNAVPFVAYTHEPGGTFHKEFFDQFGDPVALQKETCTADFSNLINLAKGVFFRKKQFPGEFKNIHKILNFPQYFTYQLTGKAVAEYTYTGCHTYLWNFRRKNWSSVAQNLGIVDLLPDTLLQPWDITGPVTPETAETTGLDRDCIVTAGIHDSNSSLLPYLIKNKEDFVLNSTGTWCVAMRPAESVNFSKEELGSSVFYNLDAFGQPVKTTIFLGGMEFEAYTEIFRKVEPSLDLSHYSPEKTSKVIREQKLFVTPCVVPNTGMFPNSVPRIVENSTEYTYKQLVQDPSLLNSLESTPQELLASLNLSLAIQSKTALQRAGAVNGTSIFIEGGFRKNNAYAAVLSGLFPDSEIMFTGIQEATSFGAALLGFCAVQDTSPMNTASFFDITYEPAKAHTLSEESLSNYTEKYFELVV